MTERNQKKDRLVEEKKTIVLWLTEYKTFRVSGRPVLPLNL
ncbi:hypothetical protein V3C99_000030 [Haemonchus contortus]